MKETFIKISKGIFFILVWAGCVPQAYANPYDNDEDYETHQRVSTFFFRKAPKNPSTLKVLKQFQNDYALSSKVATIILDELSSRSRILLLYAISQEIFKRYNAEKDSGTLCSGDSFFEKSQQSELPMHSKDPIPYSFGEATFSVWYTPSEKNSGSLLIHNLTCPILWKGLASAKTQEVATHFLFARLKQTPCRLLNHNKATIFLDLQIARRLMENDKIPVASAIINFLKLSKKYPNDYPIHYLFEKPTMEESVDPEGRSRVLSVEEGMEQIHVEETYNGYNPFEGASWMGEVATKNILTEAHKRKVGKSKHKKDEAKDNMKQEARNRWIDEQAQKWWITECLKLNKEIEEMSHEEEAKKRELRDGLECTFIVNKKKDQWIQENRKKLDDEYRIISLYYKYFGGISEDDDYLQVLEN